MNQTDVRFSNLQQCAEQLEHFRLRVGRHCQDLEDGVKYCAAYMRDTESQKLLRKGYTAAKEIKNCLFPVQRLFDKLTTLAEASQDPSR